MSISNRLAKFLTVGSNFGKRPAAIQEIPITTGAEGSVIIPSPDPTAEDAARDRWQKLGQRLARQDDWEKLSREIRKADDMRALTPGGMSIAELLAFGARADVVGAVEHAFLDGRPDKDAPLLDGIEALETVLCDYPDDYAIALVVSLAHQDLAWVWRGQGEDAQIPPLHKEAFNAHMDRARDILSRFCGKSLGAPSLIAACCGLRCTDNASLDKMVKAFEALIKLNPMDVRQLRNFGTRLMPSHDGDYTRLELEARRTAGALYNIWGAGGYTWVMFDAASNDEEVLAGLDVAHFTKGLQDILALRPDQYTVNLLAAYCAVTMSGQTGHDAADFNRKHIHKCRDWIICDYLTELHPLIWAHAAHGFDNNLRVRSVERFADTGLAEARRVLNALFLPELARGQNVTFSENGPAVKSPA